MHLFSSCHSENERPMFHDPSPATHPSSCFRTSASGQVAPPTSSFVADPSPSVGNRHLHRSWLPLQHDPSLRQRPMRPLMVSAAISPGHHRQQRHLRHSKTPSTAAPSVPSLCSSPLPYTSTHTRHCCTRRLRKRRLGQHVTDTGTDQRCAMVTLIHVGSRRTKARWAEVVASL